MLVGWRYVRGAIRFPHSLLFLLPGCPGFLLGLLSAFVLLSLAGIGMWLKKPLSGFLGQHFEYEYEKNLFYHLKASGRGAW
jgi:hypothetical protein